MFKLALRTVFAKKLRFVSTALSIMLAVAFLVGTVVFTDTMRRTFDDLFADIYADTDTVVRSASSVEDQMGFEMRGRIPASTLDAVRAVDGVAAAEGSVFGFAQLVGADGKVIGRSGQGPPSFGQNFVTGTLGVWQLTEGSRVPGPGELVIDVASARDGNLEIGDDVTIVTQTGPQVLPLVGTARFGTVDSPSGAHVSLFDLATAQQLLLGGAAEFDEVLVDAAPGVSEDELTARIAAVLPEGHEALTGSAIIKETQDQIAEALGFFGVFLTVFAVIGLVVACFTIFNTFQIIITQRIKEMALLRAIGATRAQVLGAQLVEAVIVGVVASLVGLAVGVGVAGLLKSLLAAFGIDMPAGGTVFLARTGVIAVIVGMVVTVGSAVFPALRASRIPPIAALRDVALEPAGQTGRRLAVGGTLTALGLAGFIVGLAGRGISWVGVGALATFVGVFVLGPLLTRPIAGPLSAPLPRLTGVTGQLARENALRNPKRTARTGAALMVGVALVVGITVIASAARQWVENVFEEQFTGDFVVNSGSFGYGGLSPQLAADLSELPEFEATSGIRSGAARLITGEREANALYSAVDPATVTAVFDVDVIEGDVATLTASQVMLDDDEADKRGVAVGDTLTFEFLDGQRRDLTVSGIYTKDDLAGNFVVSQELHEMTGVDQFDLAVYLLTADGISDAQARAAITRLTEAYPNADVLSRGEYLDEQTARIDPLVNLMYALLALAIGIALFSIANSMALSIHERTHELGLLRAVGMTRHQIGSVVRWESILVALLGAGAGVVLGVFFGWAISVTVGDSGLGAITLPIVPILVVAALALVGALIAVTRPAWRAVHLDVLQAIATE